MMYKKGSVKKGKSLNVQFLEDQNLNKSIYIGFTATKKIGSAIKRNKAKNNIFLIFITA